MTKLDHIKNVLSVDVDGINGVNRYTIKGMYNEIDDDGFSNIVYKLMDDFYMTWDDIKDYGGIDQVNADLRECYGV